MNWIDRLQKAVRRRRFTRTDVKRALDWTRCAVGEAHAKAPKIVIGCLDLNTGPGDDSLFSLGGLFGLAVERHQVVRALGLYYEIEDRVQVLRAERAAAKASA